MYECRCPHDGRKLAEIARLPLSLMKVEDYCPCGRLHRGEIVLDQKTNHILALLSCSCGRVTLKVVGYGGSVDQLQMLTDHARRDSVMKYTEVKV